MYQKQYAKTVPIYYYIHHNLTKYPDDIYTSIGVKIFIQPIFFRFYSSLVPKIYLVILMNDIPQDLLIFYVF